MPDATYVGAGMPCGNCGNPLTPGQPHKCGRVGNPYAPSSDWKPGQDTFTAQAAGIWEEGFASRQPEIDRLETALREIAGSDPVDNALDPHRNVRIARAAVSGSSEPRKETT